MVEELLKKDLSKNRKNRPKKKSNSKTKEQDLIALENAQDKSPDDMEIYD